MTPSRSTTGTAKRTPCWAAGAAEKGLLRSYHGATSCWWCSVQTETEPTEDSPRLILAVNVLYLQLCDLPRLQHICIQEQLFLRYDCRQIYVTYFFLLLLSAIQVVPVNVSCTRSEFTILIPQQSLPQLDRESIYLGNPTCAAQLTATSYKILAQFVNCGTAGQVTTQKLK